jgi:hypothetical protein
MVMMLAMIRNNAPKKAAIVKCIHSVISKKITLRKVTSVTVACQVAIKFQGGEMFSG